MQFCSEMMRLTERCSSVTGFKAVKIIFKKNQFFSNSVSTRVEGWCCPPGADVGGDDELMMMMLMTIIIMMLCTRRVMQRLNSKL